LQTENATAAKSIACHHPAQVVTVLAGFDSVSAANSFKHLPIQSRRDPGPCSEPAQESIKTFY
jgi:hypothetical protein